MRWIQHHVGCGSCANQHDMYETSDNGPSKGGVHYFLRPGKRCQASSRPRDQGCDQDIKAYPVVICTSLKSLLPHDDTSMTAAFQSELEIVLWSLHPSCQGQPRNPLCPPANVRNMHSDISAC